MKNDRQPEAMAKASKYLVFDDRRQIYFTIGGTARPMWKRCSHPMKWYRRSVGAAAWAIRYTSPCASAWPACLHSAWNHCRLLLDDILLRFDEGRQNAALKLLAHIGQSEPNFDLYLSAGHGGTQCAARWRERVRLVDPRSHVGE